ARTGQPERDRAPEPERDRGESDSVVRPQSDGGAAPDQQTPLDRRLAFETLGPGSAPRTAFRQLRRLTLLATVAAAPDEVGAEVLAGQGNGLGERGILIAGHLTRSS